MKKLLITLSAVAIMLCAISISAYAATGDVVDHIYSTDILAYVNGAVIPSYCLDGKTAIAVEDLDDHENYSYGYGFSWLYDDSTRTLTVNSTASGYHLNDGAQQQVYQDTVGRIVGDIYETDIKVIFNGRIVPSYNSGGRTVVCIEDLGTLDNAS